MLPYIIIVILIQSINNLGALSFSYAVRKLLLAENFLFYRLCGGGSGDTSLCGFAERFREQFSGAKHCFQNLVGRYRKHHAAYCEVGADERVHSLGSVTLRAGDLHKSCERVADKPHHVHHRYRERAEGVRWGMPCHFHGCSCRHRRSCAALSLTASLRSGDCCVLGYD